MRRGLETVVGNPFSGQYEGSNKNAKLELNVDLDKLREHSTVLNTVSGTLTGYKEGSDSSACFFQSITGTLKVVSEEINSKRTITCDLRVVDGDGNKFGGKLELILMLPQDDGTWNGRAKVSIKDTEIVFESVTRSSLFFKEVTLDIDYTENLVWPELILGDLPNGKSNRKLDIFSAFEDAGLTMKFNRINSKKINDPTPKTPWTRSDMYDAMMQYFDEGKDSDENIWCLVGTTPPDKRYMGFSFHLKGRNGFGIFTGHKSFQGYDSFDPLTRALASRRLLHYFVHECGHCLGLEHPFEMGEDNALSWMNYAWKYDETHKPGSFYESFRFKFTEMELRLLRHSPSSKFRKASKHAALDQGLKSSIPDVSLADDDSDDDEENIQSQPKRKIRLDLKIKDSSLLVGEAVSFEARIKNVGILPVLVEGNLTIEGGYLKVFITRPDGTTQVVKSVVNPIHSGYTRPVVLYSATTACEGTDRFSDMLSIGAGSDGNIFTEPGRYTIRALYSGGRYKATSDAYEVTINPTQASELETDEEVAIATELGSASSSRFRRVQDFWTQLTHKDVEEKKKKIDVFIKLAADLVKTDTRETEYGSSGSDRGYLKVRKAAVKTPKEILDETSDLLEYMQNRGTKSDNIQYSRLVMARCQMNLMLKNVKESAAEFYRMISDLLARGVKEPVLTKLQKHWKGLTQEKNTEVKYTAVSLQKRLDEVLAWAPSTEGDGETELSGIGLGRPFNNFDQDHIKLGFTIIEMLFNKHEETKDLVAVLRFADKLQKSREVNHHVLHWALEAFIVHSTDAKKAGIKYPEPKDMDQTMLSSAAMIATRRTGQPNDDWMLYWRSDADFNYHHRHWHIVFIVGRFFERGSTTNSTAFPNAPPHLDRQGELFGYMHSQMLARYDAERESWGLAPVQPWEYRATAAIFNAGLEFHSDPQYSSYTPRPTSSWRASTINNFESLERRYSNALQTGQVANGVELTPNWSGHILEASSGLYTATYGSLHNSGHGVFGTTGIPNGFTTYMNDSANACRDPIFFRWHKRIDDLWQANNDYYRVDLGRDAPPVIITPSDIVIDTAATPPANFDSWNGNWADNSTRDTNTIRTNLGPPSKRFEWDNKISHEEFYYHLRVRRDPQRREPNDLRLTFRIFIVPKNRELERKRYIEMDKFVYTLPAGVDHAVLTRADRHSSVIKRIPAEMTNNVEAQFAAESPGFCECGWPYHMLLPRGNSDGQEYSLCVVVTDNTIDSIGFRTTCGSMSFCGTRGRPYPDTRNMGYPFCSPMEMNRQTVSVTDAIDFASNAARTSFLIKNNIGAAPTMDAIDVWSPFRQLGLDDGTANGDQVKSEYRLSSWTGRFRVLVDDVFIRSANTRIMLRFQGRGARGGVYRMSDVKIGRRVGATLGVESETVVRSGGSEAFVVPEEGLLSDPFDFSLDPAVGDYFVTFTLSDPGVFLPVSGNSRTIMTYRVADVSTVASGDWNSVRSMSRSRNVYCLSGIMGETSVTN